MVRHTTTYVLLFFIFTCFTPLFGQNAPFKNTLKVAHQNLKFEQTVPQSELIVEGLTRGQSYLIHLGIADIESCMPIPTMDIPFEILREDGAQLFIDFVARETTAKVFLETPCKRNEKNTYVANFQCITCPIEKGVARNGPVIQADSDFDANYLVKEVFVAGGCYDVQDIVYTGDDIGKGYFSNGESINVEDGIILATGNVAQCSGPNNATDTGTRLSGKNGDGDLSTLLRISGSSITSVTDVAILEFEFTPTSDKVSFEYVWASEEYCDFSYSEFNDVFGFFVSGPGISGPFNNNAVNIAKIPGSNDYVSINNINWRNNKPYYNNNAPLGQTIGFFTNDCTAGELFASPVAKNELEYDGFTDVMTATVDVIPCETYHIKLAVGDVGDDIFDSAVFLKANSFKLGDPAELATEIPNATFPDSNLVYESCQESFFVFKRTEDSDITQPQVVPFTISDLSTAKPGVDYAPINSPVTIPRGQDSIRVPLSIFDDGVDEGAESIIFELESACTCEGILTELIIAEPEDPNVFFDELATCPGGTVNLSPNVEGGIGELSYVWSTDETDAIISAEINDPTTYSVTVTDECGATSMSEITVQVEEQVAKLEGNMLICNGEADGAIEVQFTGSAPFSLEYEFNGETRNITNIPDANYILPETEAGTYEAIKMSSNGCEGKGEGVGEIVISDLLLEFKIENPRCNKTIDGYIELTLDETEGSYIYEWDNGADDAKIENLSEGDYSVKVIDNLGCEVTESFYLTKPEPLTTKIEALGHANCYTPNGGSINLEVEGGTSGYAFEWTNGAGVTQNPTNLEGGKYEVKITDAKGCETIAEAEILSDLEAPRAVIKVDDIISCVNDEITLTAVGTSIGRDYTYNWETGDGNIQRYKGRLLPVVDEAGTYKLTVQDTTNGCITTEEVFVKKDTEEPQIEFAETSELNCQTESQILQGTILEEMVDYSLEWTSQDGNFLSDTDILSPEIDAAGTYNVKVINNINGCEVEKSVSVIENKVKPEVQLIEPLELTCDRNAVSIKTEVGMPEKDYEFNWQSVDGNFLENRNTLTPAVDKPGTYTLEVTDIENFCVTQIEARVQIDTISPKVNAGETAVFTCDRTVLNLTAEIVDTRVYEIEWTTEDGSIVNGIDELNPTIDQSGEYFLFVKDEVNGCEGKDRVIITDDINRPKVEIATPDAITCTNLTVVLDAFNSTKTGSINFRWETTNGQIIDATNPIYPEVGEHGTYILYAVDQLNGCEGKASVEVPLDTIAPTALITSPEVFNCKSTEVNIDGSGSSAGSNFLYNWTTEDGQITSKTDVVSPKVSAAGTYNVEVLNTENGCTATASLLIIDEKPTDVDMAIDQPLCYGDRGQANVVNVQGGIGPFTYSIDGGNRFHNEAGFNYLQPGLYNVVVRDANDCEIEEVVQIIEPEQLTVDLGAQIEIDLGDSTKLEVSSNIPMNEIAEIIWSPADGLSCSDCPNPIARPFQSIDYQVDIIDQNGCEANTQLRFMVDQTPHIFVPNVFKPFDSQAGNDRFTVFAKQGMVNQIVSLEVYNRWGETVFQRKNFTPNDPTMGWDGFFDRQRMKPAVFVYRAEVEMIDGRKVQLTGDFALVE